jgi:hypothetical protein
MTPNETKSPLINFIIKFRNPKNNLVTEQLEIYASSKNEAISRFFSLFTNKQVFITGVFEQTECGHIHHPDSNWFGNVQSVRIMFPPLEDLDQDAEAELLTLHLQEYINSTYKKKLNVCVSLGGFYRADKDWDNIDSPEVYRGSGNNRP